MLANDDDKFLTNCGRIYLDLRLKNRFIKFRFENSCNSCIARIGYISQFINCWKKAVDM